LENNLAVLIDFENIAAGTEKEGLGRFDVETLMRHIKDKGRILVARSYADWGRFSRFKQSLLTSNVTMMELTSHGMQDKNRADIAMVVDALEMAFTKDYIDAYVVVSGDSDFTPMVLKMRELNKRVIGIGTRKSTSRLLIQACDEFNFYDTIVQPKQKRARKTTGKRDALSSAFDLLEEALDGLQRENPESPLASIVKSAMLRKSPDFAEGDLGFSSFARFLEAARDAKVVRIGRDRKSGGYRVDSADSPVDIDEEDVLVESSKDGDWSDPYLPETAGDYVTTLDKAGLHPLAAPTRLAVLEALEEVVAARKKRRRKTTIKYVVEDLQKKLRRTHPDLPPGHIKGLLNGLMLAGELIHRDGTAIRSHTAAFTLGKDAQGLNQALTKLLLRTLKKAEADLSKTEALAELLYGDGDRRREVEETLAYLEADTDLDDLSIDNLLVASDDDDDDDDDDLSEESTDEALFGDLDDLDALIEAEPEGSSDAEAEEEAPKPRRRTRSRKPAEPASLPAEPGDDLDAALAPADAPAAPAPRKRRTTRKKKEPEDAAGAEPAADVAEPAAEAPAAEADAEPDDAETADDEAPKKRRVRRRPKKEETADEDAVLEVTDSGVTETT